MEPARFGQVEGGEDRRLAGGERGALRNLAVCGGESDEVHAIELVAEVAPCIADGVLGDTDEQQGQPGQLHVGPDPVLAIVKYRA